MTVPMLSQKELFELSFKDVAELYPELFFKKEQQTEESLPSSQRAF